MPDATAVHTKVQQLFTLTGIERVICVDDYYEISVEKVKSLCADLASTPEKLEAILLFETIDITPYFDDWSSQLEALLATLDKKQLEDLHSELYSMNPETLANSPSPIATLLASYNFSGISPREWYASETELLAQDGITLLLFDRHLGRENEGMEIIQSLFSNGPKEKIICGLLSSSFTPDEEYPLWHELASMYEVNRDSFLLISKGHENPESSIEMVKLIVLNRLCGELKAKVLGVMISAQQASQEKVNEIDIYDFEHMVFKTSFAEGIWETDTLIRLFGIFQRHEVLNLARGDATLHNLTQNIRDAIKIPVKSKGEKSQFARNVMKLEHFENGNYLIQHHVPLDLGDIFQTLDGVVNYYMLVTQPCDLMVREDGKRTIQEGMLAKVVLKNSSPYLSELNSYALTYFKDGEEYCVDLRRPISVNLQVLDLCIFDGEGMARLVLDSSQPKALIPSWKKRYTKVQNYFKEPIEKLKIYIKAGTLKTEDQELFLPFSSQDRRFKADLAVTTTETIIQYPLKRVSRLRQPISGEVLLRLANHNARTAFEHYLDKN